ncbi:ubiquitin/ISG15-conjugating enzyme E2 L6 isoform X1 [Opisthocomus hoazin]|uniref:ubiquitin/ISG15-conjugating enzyme E2 L6 isoform X1 n=1 Tax=Opisthocomus hoazin TaxID=30419 RepID=UPI003F52BF48
MTPVVPTLLYGPRPVWLHPPTPCSGRGWSTSPRLPGAWPAGAPPRSTRHCWPWPRGSPRSWRRRGAGPGPASCGRWRATCGAGRGCCCPIYHPGVDPDGHVCQPLTSAQHWVPTTRAIQVLQDLLLLLDSPDPQRVLRQDLARELQDQPEVFLRRAEEHTRHHAEQRPGP